MKSTTCLIMLLVLIFSSCQKDDDVDSPSSAKMTFEFQFDKQQERLDGFGNPTIVADGHAAQSPDFNSMSVHYIEFVPTKYTQVGAGLLFTKEKRRLLFITLNLL